jgi:biopolymer transport protein ExbD
MAGTQNIGESSDNPVAINVTAMVDVIFCLCLFFMCSFQFKQLEGKVESWLPKHGSLNTPAGEPFIRDEIRVRMAWIPETSTTTRTVAPDRTPLDGDAELMAVAKRRSDELTSAGKTDWPLMIDADPDVPWKDVVHVMDLCKNANMARIEFAAPEAPE